MRSDSMKRFYVKRVSDFVTVMHRPTHQMIKMGRMDEEMKKAIKSYIKMTPEEFYRELNALGLKFNTKDTYNEQKDTEKEDWYNKAWLMTTNQVLKEFKIKQDSIPEENVPLDFIRELQHRAVGTWNLNGSTKTPEEPKEAPEEPKKKPKKLTKKVKNEKVVPLVPFKTKAEARSAYLKKRITREEYKEYSKVLE